MGAGVDATLLVQAVELEPDGVLIVDTTAFEEAGVGPGSELVVEAVDATSVAVTCGGASRPIAREAAAAIWITA